MSFANKVLSVFIQNKFNNTISGAITSSARNFHVLVKTLPRTLVGASTLSKSLVASSAVSPLFAVTGSKSFLSPVSSLLNHISGFKVKGRLKRRCKDCYFVVRQQRHYVICPTHPRHKQMAMKKREYKSWILTHATQSKIRPY